MSIANHIIKCHLAPEQEIATDMILLQSCTRLYGWILCCNYAAVCSQFSTGKMASC